MDERTTPGVCRVVTGSDLEAYTRDGWEIVRVYDCFGKVDEREEIEERNGCRYSKRVPIYGTTQSFLLRLAPESALAKAGEQIERLQREVYETSVQCGKEARDGLEWKQRAERAEANVASWEERYERVGKLNDEMRSKLRAIEVDLGKVRREVGEREWARIVGRDDDE